MTRPLRKILVANRGAIARRVIRACTSLGIPSVAVYSEADAGAPYLDEASEALPLQGVTAADTYLNVPALLDCLERSGADALHPGYGFLSERADFARAVAAAGAVFIGPAARFLDLMGDKVNGRTRMAEAGFPVLPGSGRLADAAAALQAAEQIGYPLMLKPAAGGGGIGMYRVDDAAELHRVFGRASRLAAAAFDDAGLFLEQAVERPRHVEIQVLGDGRGRAVHLYERECSLQRRHQKVIEEAPAPGLDRRAMDELAEQAAAAVATMGYDSIGTVEMLRRDDGVFGFIEMNTRIQVEHGVSEAVTGLDLVAAQIRLAAGGALPERVPLDGFAIEARVYAEDPYSGYASTGTLAHFRVPEMHQVRVDTGYAAGQSVTPYYDPLLAKVIAGGRTREQAIGRLLVGLKGLEVRGVATNIPLLQAVLEDEDFLAGNIDTGFLGRRRWLSAR